MRRGHPTGIGGWRNVNPRGFRPRGGGTPSFRPTRPYALFETPRYQPPRPYKDYNVRQGPVEDHNRTDRYSHDHDKIKFRVDNRQNVQNRHQDRGHQRHNYYPRVRQPASNTTYGETSHYYENTSINSMGDVDHRQSYVHPNQEHQHNVSPWVNTPTDNKKHYDDKNQNYKHDVNESNKMLLVDYTGHRPPASDHYDGNPGPALDNSNTFSRSVDDTVNIVRKRLLSRNESQQSSCDDQNQEKDKDERVKPELCPSVQQEQPMKKKIQRQRQNIQLNCAKIKTKIVHQLFKMDKDKIHKLMDNPNSSTKFEYAISSLITESQNSYNRHLRSVAEKSLCSSSTEFMQNDNNTIYEDTFMKQMQCILDPQDTVLLEDIKPMVMAELSKVLQLGNFLPDDQTIYQSRDEQPNYDEYNSYDKHSHSTIYYPEENCGHIEQNVSQVTHDVCIQSEILTSDNEINKSYEYNKEMQYNDTKPLYERRPIKKSNSYSEERRISSERRHSRRSLDNKTMEEKISNEAQVPLFDTNAEQFSDEEDPFAELDKQYHVAVDHNFIESDYPVSQPSSSKSPSVKSDASNKFNTPEKQIYDIRTDDNSQQTTAASKSQMAERNTCRATQSKLDKDIDSQLLNIAKSPIKLSLGSYKNSNEEHQNFKHLENLVKQELIDSCGVSEEKETYMNVVAEFKDNDLDKIIKQENIPECKDNNDINDKSENHTSITKSALSSNSRKRSIDQRPSHRKEKRKKSESCQMETNKQILNKNIIINLSDCAANSSEKCDAPKSIFNLFFSKDDSNKEVSKDNKSSDLDKGYSDKYVKRKETPKKIKETEIKRKHNSNSFSNSAVSPKMNNVTNINIQTPSKAESKAKLKTIDMFLQQPKKMTLHQAHRNTVLMPSIHNKSEENKPKLSLSTTNKLLKRHVATQVIKKYQTKDTQTIQTRKIMRAIQTDPVTYLKTEITSTDPFERMKEIDFEIQLLLQEKFKLYNSMESKDSCPSTMQNLGMTVLNFDATKDNDTTTSTAFSGDAIAEDFTNIPVEELEQIAFGTVDDDAPVTPKLERKSKRQKILQQDRKSSVSPITATKRNTRKSKTPNISLIEQIITDDRPLEDIISLDDLEAPIVKTKKKPQKQTQKKKVNKKTKSVTSLNIKDIKLKPCSVVIIRENIEKYLQSIPEEVILDEPLPTNIEILIPEPEIVEMDKNVVEEEKDIVEEVVTDMQFDMLDVSEDIVIGDNCEDKLVEEKDADDRIEVPITEEIILDNSQSSADDGLADTIHNSNMCRTFDYSGDENLRRDSVLVTGNADAVLAIECIESNFIAACLDGNVYYFSGDGQLISTLRGSNLAVTCLTIVKEKYGTTVYTGSLDSRIRYYDLETGLEKGPECNVLSPIQTMDRAWDTVFVGTRTGFVLQFECKNNMLIPVSTVKFSEQSILALRAMKEGPRKVLLVAARSENVTIKDAQTGLLLRILNGPKMTVYTLLYEDGKVYCGTSSHQIHVFDYTSGGHVGTHEGGKGAVCLRSAGGLLFAGCYDGCVYVYREGECRPFAQLRGPSLMLLSLAIVGSKIIAGYKDRSLYIWKIPLSILQEMIL